MKFSSAWTLSMLLMAASLNQSVWAQEEGAAEAAPAETTEAPAETTEAPAEGAEGESGETVVPEVDVPEIETFEPKGDKTRPYQYIFDQGTMSWDGFEVVKPFSPSREIVGRVDGQTGWTGINQDGDKTMSYQIAVIVKAIDVEGNDLTLNKVFAQIGGPIKENKASSFGMWIPERKEDNPPEDWFMNLMHVNLYPVATSSNIRCYQSMMRNRGLYEKIGAKVDPYYVEFFDQKELRD